MCTNICCECIQVIVKCNFSTTAVGVLLTLNMLAQEMHKRVMGSCFSLFVCLSVSLLRAGLEGRSLQLNRQKRHRFKEYKDLSLFNVPLFNLV